MANVIGTKRIIIDTSSGSALIAAGGEQLQVLKIRWVGASAPAQTVSIQDANGNIFWESISGGANYVEIDTMTTDRESDDAAFRLNGLKVPTLGGGKIYIYLR